jgi:hypothetical protein
MECQAPIAFLSRLVALYLHVRLRTEEAFGPENVLKATRYLHKIQTELVPCQQSSDYAPMLFRTSCEVNDHEP